MELDDEHIEEPCRLPLLQQERHHRRRAPPSPLPGEGRTTVAIAAVIIARDDVSEADVYNVVSGIFESVDTLSHDKKAE